MHATGCVIGDKTYQKSDLVAAVTGDAMSGVTATALGGPVLLR